MLQHKRFDSRKSHLMSSNPSKQDRAVHEPTRPDVLDDAALDKLRALDPSGRAGIVQRVLRTYDGSLQKLMLQFEQAAAAGDVQGLSHVAHTLRSSSASVGALRFSAFCGEVEGLIREGHPDRLPPALEAMRAESRVVAAAVRAMLDSQGPCA
jgi:HPt (histidine-containing phosphotransfer) domain-containing protein